VSAAVFLFQDFRFESGSGELFRVDRAEDAAPVVLGARAAALLTLLAERSGRLVSKSEIMDVVWGGRVVEEANLTVQVAALRRLLDIDGTGGRSLIQTLSGRGYRLVPPVTRAEPPAPASSQHSPAKPAGEAAAPHAPAERRLSAILCADIAGYSRLIGSDEEGTLRRLQALWREAVDPAVAAHGGRVVKATGDGVLVEFASVVNAVSCAIVIQRDANSRDADLPDDRRLALRIGINLGDIVVEGDDIFGDGVNIAARLETAAEPGGIWLSASAYEQVRDKIKTTFVDLGEHTLRNIARPVRAYRVMPDAEPGPVPLLSSIDMSKPVPGFAGRPAIAVLPFDNLSGDPEQEYFVDGIAEDILTRLAMWRRFPAIARRSSFSYKGRAIDVKEVGRELGARYILEGAVRKAGNRVRITGQLIDAIEGYQVWADRYDRAIADVFVLQDEIADAIATALEPAVGRAEMQRAQRSNPESLDAWDLHQRGMWFLSKTTREDTETARALFQRSATAEPNFAAPLAALGLLGFLEVSLGYAAAPKEAMAAARIAAAASVRLDELDPYAQAALGYAAAWNREYDVGLTAARRAVELNPSFALGYHSFGAANFLAGRFDESIVAMERSVRMGPSDPWLFLYLNGVSFCRYMRRDYEGCIEAARLSLERFEQYPSGPLILAMALAQLGRKAEAERALAYLLNLAPGYTFEAVRHARPFQHEADLAFFVDGLRKAGLPE
jgi:adenylate cyclase